MNMLVERDEQWRILEGAFDECIRGKQRTVLISGVIAAGKTAFLDAFIDWLADSDAIVLSVLASHGESDVPLGILEQLLDCLRITSGGADQLTNEPLGDACPVVTTCYGVEKPRNIPIVLLRRICKALQDLAVQHPIVLCIDDIHHADAESLEGLLYILRRLRSARLLVVLTECPHMHYKHPVFRTALLCHTTCLCIRLKLLSIHGVKAVLDEALDSNTATQLAPRLHHMSGGNPLLLRALIEDHLSVAGATTAEVVVDEFFRQAVLSCLYRCDTTTLNIGRALAIVGESASPGLLGRLVEVDVDSVTRSLRALNAFGLLDSGRFRCAESLAAVLSDMAAAERAVLHERVAQLLYNEGADVLVVAKQLISADSVSMPWALSVLQDAAKRALSDSDFDLSIACMRLAEQLCTDGQRQLVVSEVSARAQWQINPCAVNRRLPELLEVVRNGFVDRRQVITLIGYLLWHGHATDAIDIFGRLIDTCTGPSPQYECEIELVRLWLSYSYPGLFDSGRGGNMTPAHQDVERGPMDAHLRAAALLGDVLAGGPQKSTRVGAEHLLQATRLTDSTLAPIACALASLIYTEHLDTAASWCALFVDEATKNGIPFWRAVLESLASALSVRQGNQRTAYNYARSALSLLTYEGWGVLIGVPLASLVFATTAMGRYSEAASYLAIPVPSIMFDTPVGLHYLHARGRYLLALDRCYAALDDFQRCGRLMTSWGMDVPTIVPWRTEVAQIYLRMGKTTQAQELTHAQLSRLRCGDSITRGMSLRILAATQDLPRRLSTLREAADMLESCSERFELARVLADLSRVHQSIGQHGAARMHARRAHRLARECGADAMRWTRLPDLAVVEASGSNRVPAMSDQIKELSNAERRVAMLAAEGYTNRQIAKRLFITVSTVEQHMTRIYRKVGVNRRTDLATVLDTALAGASANDKRSIR